MRSLAVLTIDHYGTNAKQITPVRFKHERPLASAEGK